MMNRTLTGPVATLGLSLLVVVLLALAVSCDGSSSHPSQYQGDDHPSEVINVFGQVSLEEMIASVDVIARVRLGSVTAFAEELDLGGEIGRRHFAVMEYTLNVQEYIQGTGDNTIKAGVIERGLGHTSSGDAAVLAAQFLEWRDPQWDNKEAIVFLEGEHPGPYGMGSIDAENGPYYGDEYSIASPHTKYWLPEVAGARGASSASSSNKRFFLDAPTGSGGGGGASGASRSSSSTPTITLASLKTKVRDFNQELSSGGRSDAYRMCLIDKREAERRVRERGDLPYQRPLRTYNKELQSGLPAGAVVYPKDYAGDRTPVTPGRWDGVRDLRGQDAHLFVSHNSEVVDTTRPLPAGEYRYYEEWQRASLVICNGQPSETERDYDIIVTVTAPDGTLHEAFFDPVSSGDAVGYFGAGDALRPTTFTTGDATTTIQSLKWQDSAVTLGLQPYNALEEHILDFITGDGTTTLSLEASAATGDSTAGTLTWAVGSQPWFSGDELMLRLHRPETTPSFGQDSYSFSVAESASTFTIIGTVPATDEDGDTITYHTISGNEGGAFQIDLNEGFILLWKELDYETTSSYDLTVEARDPGGRKDTATVTINVTDVPE